MSDAVSHGRQRLLHPDGRSFAGELEVTGHESVAGPGVLEPGARHPVTVRLSKGVGTRGDRLDVRGVAVRLHLPGRDLDLLLSTAGTGPLSRHVPALRRSFDTTYGSITAYRSRTLGKVYLFAGPDREAPALGRTLADLGEGDRLRLGFRRAGVARSIGRVTLGAALAPETDAALAFDGIRNSLPGLHPTGTIHGVRAFAYRFSQRRRGATPVPDNPAAVARTNAHR
jgi:hypothetical protein